MHSYFSHFPWYFLNENVRPNIYDGDAHRIRMRKIHKLLGPEAMVVYIYIYAYMFALAYSGTDAIKRRVMVKLLITQRIGSVTRERKGGELIRPPTFPSQGCGSEGFPKIPSSGVRLENSTKREKSFGNKSEKSKTSNLEWVKNSNRSFIYVPLGIPRENIYRFFIILTSVSFYFIRWWTVFFSLH